ncbi:sugar ABC transporter substrate-binding protein [Pantoea agglomerans]|jgi:hypothetical protein|uniref:sugar ABC transporter substrate-binding protein n=1 Tax=Pantoea TaxID=53335 RepID=UPI002448DCD5|nr:MULTISPECIES: sugar ABC transporter substrate-binding protein [Pantoea]MDH1089046.1 sugar ABC transporter substrate-binding protein [Pantoea brenneri]MDU4129801.1 sugar ABC transporter substrate-binding protein [Pantoea sp.]
MKHPDSVYYTEGVSGQRKFTFEVFREADGSYRAVAARWNARVNKVVEQTQFTAPDKAGLREQPYPSTRQVKIFLNSEFWNDSNV